MTKEQKFWEKCGFKIINNPDFPDNIEESRSPIGERIYPPIDLNSLFKYAVPKIGAYEITFDDESSCIYVGEDPDIKCYEGIDEDPAQALYQALCKVLGVDDE